MGDQRDDEIPEPTESPDEASATDDSFEIVEQTPPPATGDESEPTAVDVTPVPETPPPAPPPPPPVDVAPVAPPPPLPPSSEPAPAPVATDDPGAPSGWPTAAKVLVVILAILTVAGIVASIVGFSRASSAEEDVDSRGVQLDEVIARNDTLVRELEESEAARDEIARENNDLIAERAELLGAVETAEAERDAALAELDAERARLEGLLTEAADELAALQDELAALQDELDEFPVEAEIDLGQVDLSGLYDMTFTEIDCSGLELCGEVPGPADAVVPTSGGLRLEVPTLFVVPLAVVDGAVVGAADDLHALIPPCEGIPRSSTSTVTLFADGLEVAADGTSGVSSLGATVVFDVPAFEECGAGRVSYRLALQATG